MARLGETFDATTVEPNKPLEALPPGRYVVQIVNSEMRPTKDGMGQYLWLELDVLEGEYAGRKLFDRLNLINANPTTVEIAQRTLSAICHADRPDAGRRQRAAASHPADRRRQGAAAEERLRRLEHASVSVARFRATAAGGDCTEDVCASPGMPLRASGVRAKSGTAPWRRGS